MENNKHNTSILETLKASNLNEIPQDILEMSIDLILSDGLIKELPIIKWLSITRKTVHNFYDYFFIKKIIKYLISFNDISLLKRQQMIHRLESDSNFGKQTGEKILFLLSQLDDLEKPKMMANAFKAYCREKINSDDLYRLCYAIKAIFICDIKNLLPFYKSKKNEEIPLNSRLNFINCGLAYVVSGLGVGGMKYTDLCELFLKYVLEEASIT